MLSKSFLQKNSFTRSYLFLKRNLFLNVNDTPFITLYQNVTGESIPTQQLEYLTKKEPSIFKTTSESLKLTLNILKKFEITAEEACYNPHLFCINLISLDNYGEILKECGFIKILPSHLIRYNTIVKSRTISKLKKQGLINTNLCLEQILLDIFQDWPQNEKFLKQYSDVNTNILTVRMSVLQRYLEWRLGITNDKFTKFSNNNLPLKHRPMVDIHQSLDIAENVIKFDRKYIRNNSFIISSDPLNTRLILENVDSLAGVDIKEAIRLVPAILKNNYRALLEIKEILREYEIIEEAQKRYLRVYCMNPDTVRSRLNDLVTMNEFKVLASNPRILSMVVHYRKVLNRLTKIESEKKQCFSLNTLVAPQKIFNTYISNFGSRVCSRDMAIHILSSLKGNYNQDTLVNTLKRHKYWLHTAISVVHDNICMLKKYFDDQVILDNCQLLLYPGSDIERHISRIQKIRNSASRDNPIETHNNLNYSRLTDSQILSLVLYEIEKKYHFSGDGIWSNQDGMREHTANRKSHASS
ncbi:unnamed protein product [Leptosia nina]|uniref:Transcription termination factor 5, mitochondrial n=1 Tax=Leptosia nina TaxID=320188 RepID=A0AAV1JJ53_9NEOP